MRQMFFAVVLLMLVPSIAGAWTGRVAAVIDGDTLVVEPIEGGEHITIRLHGIDAPERKQPGGETATGFVFCFLYQAVEVEPKGKPDRYGCTVAIIILPDGDSLQAALLRAGLAWVWPLYCRDCQEWQALQEEARVAGRGIWQHHQPIEPWKWRKGEK